MDSRILKKKEGVYMENDYFPILVIPAIPNNGSIRFLHPRTQYDIGSENAEDVWKILSYCNGFNSIEDVAALSGIDIETVTTVVEALRDLEVMEDAREQFMHFHRVSSYPPAYARNLTQDEVEEFSISNRKAPKSGIKEFAVELEPHPMGSKKSLFDIRNKRRSVRYFSSYRTVDDKLIGELCNFAYSIPDHAVPSGGALYPLRIYLLLEKPHGNLPAGYYEYDAEKNKLILFKTDVDIEQLKYCFNQETLPFNSIAQIIIAADFRRQTYKYSNRGYRLAMIEVGHVAENISLFCAANGLGSCEMGGIQDRAMMKELELEGDEIHPILAIPFGYRSEPKEKPTDKIRYVENHVGEDKPVKQIWTHSFGENGAFFGVTSSYLDANSNVQYAGATSPAYADAAFKAAIEGYERWNSSQIPVDYEGPAKDCPGAWLDPKDYFPLTHEQASSCGLKDFTEDLPITWVKGFNYNPDGYREVYIPTDLVYYGQKLSENRIYFGHSSGIAAYSDIKNAETRAIVELIERDALMRNWYTRESPPILSDKLLPIHALNRREHWKKQNRELFILEMPSPYGKVFEAIITSNVEYPHFISGAAATIGSNYEETINKALQEAEYNLLLQLNRGIKPRIEEEKVDTPSDHGELYYALEKSKELDWLKSGKVIDEFTDFSKMEFYKLRTTLNITTVDMSLPGSELSVVRVFSPKLVPINFGYNTAHYTHPELKDVPKELWHKPHYFA